MFPLYDDNPLPGRPYVTWSLMAICILVYLVQLPLTPGELHAHFLNLGMVPAEIFGYADNPHSVPTWLTPFTSMFTHGGFMHLAGNMLYLWIFGDNIELCLGRIRFLIFYVLCGLIAAFSNALLDLASPIPLIGASGAISGVLGAYLLLFPRANVQVLMFPFGLVAVPAVLVLGFWFIMQLFSGVSSTSGGGGVAFWAHIGGFVAGMVLVRFFKHGHVRFFERGHTSPFKKINERIRHWQEPGHGPWGRRPDKGNDDQKKRGPWG